MKPTIKFLSLFLTKVVIFIKIEDLPPARPLHWKSFVSKNLVPSKKKLKNHAPKIDQSDCAEHWLACMLYTVGKRKNKATILKKRHLNSTMSEKVRKKKKQRFFRIFFSDVNFFHSRRGVANPIYLMTKSSNDDQCPQIVEYANSSSN